MTQHNPYRGWIDSLAASLREGAAIALPAPPFPHHAPPHGQPPGGKALLFSPHPDDEVITGALALRLARQCGFAVVNVAVTLGSRPDRRAERWRELESACAYLGFALATPAGGALTQITRKARTDNPSVWATKIASVANLLEAERPDIVFLPHEADWNGTHIGVHLLVTDAMRAVAGLECLVIETEFWAAMATPNLMVESTASDVADLVAALALHVGEVARNPYHVRLPAWMIDNVRRGAELVGGQGGTSPDVTFATLYRLRAWSGGAFHDILQAGRTLAATDDPATLLTAARGR